MFETTTTETDTAAPASAPASQVASTGTVMESLYGMWEAFLSHLPLIGIAVIVLFVTWGIATVADKLLDRVFDRLRMRDSLQAIVRKLIYITVWVIGVMIAITVLFPTVTPGKLLAALGLSSIAIGFAFKDIVENFFAGILILFREPFQMGDFIECEGVEGKVEDIAIRETKVRQTDGQLVVLPNAQLFKNPVTVRTDRDTRRTTVICGVAYDEDVDESRDIIRKAVESLGTINKDKPVEIFAQEFAASSINFEVTWWTGSTPLEVRESRDEVVAAVKRALDDAGIEIPFPYRTLTFKEQLTVAQSSDREAGVSDDA